MNEPSKRDPLLPFVGVEFEHPGALELARRIAPLVKSGVVCTIRRTGDGAEVRVHFELLGAVDVPEEQLARMLEGDEQTLQNKTAEVEHLLHMMCDGAEMARP